MGIDSPETLETDWTSAGHGPSSDSTPECALGYLNVHGATTLCEAHANTRCVGQAQP